MSHAFKRYLRRYSFYLGGDQSAVAYIVRLRSTFSAFIGLVLVFTMDKYLVGLSGVGEWMMALSWSKRANRICHTGQLNNVACAHQPPQLL
jgi:hypothetical protein